MREYLDLLRITSRASQSVQTCSDDAVTGDSFVLQGTVKPSPRGSNIEKSTPLYTVDGCLFRLQGVRESPRNQS